MTTIDVIIPVWNRAHAVRQAIDSVLSQRLPPSATLTVTVVDDCSSDDLSKVLSAYGSRVVCTRHARNAGPAAARNTGIAATSGDYVAFLDSDDAWLPDKLARQIDFMQTHGYAASCTAFLLVRQDRIEILAPRYPTGTLGLADLVWGCFVSPGSTLMCRRDVYKEVGDYDVALRRLEDWDWLLRYAAAHRLGFLAEPLARVEATGRPDPDTAFAALERMKQNHMKGLPPVEQRQFKAAIEVVRAATLQRNGKVLAAAFSLIKSLSIAPARNVAVATVLRNQLARR
jgi:glycosyltransferase involved in cell wall biosynthesis